MPPRRPLEDRFWEKVDRRGPDDCWNWTASTAEGYGQIGDQGQPRRAHQIAWELMVGPRTPGLVIDHLCFNKLCQNPAHLEEVAQGENARRGRARRTPQVLKEFCPRGHAYSRLSTGHRQCNECNRQNAKRCMQRLRDRRKAELADRAV
jgi:hypothetical protein